MKGSLAASALAHLEAKTWNHHRLSEFTSRFIAPSQFMYRKMVEGGFDKNKITVLCNMISPERSKLISVQDIRNLREDYFCYVGRLSKEKGVETLLSAAAQSGVQIRIAGDGPLKEQLEAKYDSYDNISFLGQLKSTEVIELLSHAKASIIPSEWYENNPIGAIESLCCGTPVIGSDIGGIPELIDQTNGIIYTSGASNKLADIMLTFDKTQYNCTEIAKRANAIFNVETHYKNLMDIYAN